MDLLHLVECKNLALKQYWEASLNCLARIEGGNLEDLEKFHAERDTILSFIGVMDKRIEEHAKANWLEGQTPLTSEIIEALRRFEGDRIQLVQEILKVDEMLLRRLEAEKQATKSQIVEAEKQKTNASRFKSEWVSNSGEKLDETL